MITTNILFEKLTSGEFLTEETINQLLSERVKEDVFLEYKHGDELKKDNAKREVRKYVSGFANSLGGIYLVGVDQGHSTVTGCSAPGGADLAEWAARTLTPIGRGILPPPRIYTVGHVNGAVLVIVTERSLNLVPTLEDGELIYYLRFHDQTLAAPEYLVTDILLGRKSFPYLAITSCTISDSQVVPAQIKNNIIDEPYKNLSLDLHVRLENQSLVWAEDVSLGLVCWIVGNADNSVNQHLNSHIEVREGEIPRNVQTLSLRHKKEGNEYRLTPFSSVNLTIPAVIIPLLPPTGPRYEYAWSAALYLLAKNVPPVWYQLRLPITASLGVQDLRGLLEVERIAGKRPTISVTPT